MSDSVSSCPKVWIVVLTWNRSQAVVSCLLSLNALRYENFELVVVDNHSEDDTVQRLRAIFPKLSLIVNDRNLGYTGGNNVGIRYALEHGADHVMILNNDAVVHADLIDELMRVAQSDPRIAVVGPKIMSYANRELVCGTWGEVTYGPTLSRIRARDTLDRAAYRRTRDVGFVAGCGYMWQRHALLEIGLLDTNFFCYHEDADWSYRARQAGWRVVYVGAAMVYHKGSLSSNPALGKCVPIMYFLARNGVLFTRKHGNLFRFCQFAFNSLLGSIQRYLANRGRGHPTGERQFWQGFLDGMLNRNRQEEFRD